MFDCLVAADTATLQNASGVVSETRGYFGSFAWLPVVDGDFVQNRPSEQLKAGEVSGKRLLVGVRATLQDGFRGGADETRTMQMRVSLSRIRTLRQGRSMIVSSRTRSLSSTDGTSPN